MFKLQTLCECFERDKKRYQGDISFLYPPVINLIKAQVCDKCCIPSGPSEDR